MGLRFLCLDGGLLPEFCGFGSLKVNSKVPPIVRVCGLDRGHEVLPVRPIQHATAQTRSPAWNCSVAKSLRA